jgi:hypothetical protein
VGDAVAARETGFLGRTAAPDFVDPDLGGGDLLREPVADHLAVAMKASLAAAEVT